MTLSREEERHRTIHRGNRRQRPEQACRRGSRSECDRMLARAVRLADESRWAYAGGDQTPKQANGANCFFGSFVFDIEQ